MKISSYILASLILLFAIHCTTTNDKTEKQLFQQVIDKQHSNYIELSGNRDSMKGVFFGVEFLNDRTPVCYKAKLDSISWYGNNIYFTLIDYVYSSEAFYPHKPKTLLKSGDERIPLIIRAQQGFSGTASTDTMDLRRTVVGYFSHADRMIFVKVANSGEKNH